MSSLSRLADRLFIQLGNGPTLDEHTLVQAALWLAIANSGMYCLLSATGFDLHFNLGVTLVYGSLLLVVRWGGLLSLSTHALLVLEFAQLAILSAQSGGINSPYIACMPLLPITALLLLNMRWAVVWLSIISIQNYFQYLAIDQEWIDGVVDPQTVSVHTVLFVKLILLIFLLLALSLYDWTYRRKIHKLSNDNRELNRIEASLREVRREIDAFAVCIEREVRVPIAMQLQLSPILIAELANAPGHLEAAHQMRVEISELLETASDMGDLTNLALGRLEFTLSSFFFPDVLQLAVGVTKAGPRASRLPINMHLDPSAQVWVHGDQSQLTQVVTRLLACARQQADIGSIELSAHFADTRVIIEVQFSPQTAKRAVPSNPLTGSVAHFALPNKPTLGMAVCEKRAAAAGGHLCVYRRGPNKLLLWLEWPLRTQTIKASSPTPTIDAVRPSSRFLVVEHVLSSQLEIQAMLKKRWPQCHVGLAESAGNALLQMEFSHYDMVLINISLPQTDGLAATHQIRAHAMPEIRATPVVGLAAKSEASERHRCLASGMQWVLFKPLEPEVFFTAITAHLGKGSSSCVQ